MAVRGVVAWMFYALLWRDVPAPNYGYVPSFPAPEKRGKILYFCVWIMTFLLGRAEGSRQTSPAAALSQPLFPLPCVSHQLKVLLNAQDLKKKELSTPKSL